MIQSIETKKKVLGVDGHIWDIIGHICAAVNQFSYDLRVGCRVKSYTENNKRGCTGVPTLLFNCLFWLFVSKFTWISFPFPILASYVTSVSQKTIRGTDPHRCTSVETERYIRVYLLSLTSFQCSLFVSKFTISLLNFLFRPLYFFNKRVGSCFSSSGIFLPVSDIYQWNIAVTFCSFVECVLLFFTVFFTVLLLILFVEFVSLFIVSFIELTVATPP